MATTIHVPRELLRRLDVRAKALGVSRNRVILDAIRGVVDERASWPPELIEMLAEPVDAATAALLDGSMRTVRRARRSRRRPTAL